MAAPAPALSRRVRMIPGTAGAAAPAGAARTAAPWPTRRARSWWRARRSPQMWRAMAAPAGPAPPARAFMGSRVPAARAAWDPRAAGSRATPVRLPSPTPRSTATGPVVAARAGLVGTAGPDGARRGARLLCSDVAGRHLRGALMWVRELSAAGTPRGRAGARRDRLGDRARCRDPPLRRSRWSGCGLR